MQVKAHAQKFIEKLFNRLRLKRKTNLRVAKVLSLPDSEEKQKQLSTMHTELSEGVLENMLINNLFTKHSKSCIDKTEKNKLNLKPLFEVRKMKQYCQQTENMTKVKNKKRTIKSDHSKILSMKNEYEFIFDEQSQFEDIERFEEWKERVLCCKNIFVDENEDE